MLDQYHEQDNLILTDAGKGTQAKVSGQTSALVVEAMRKMQEDSTPNDGRYTQHGNNWTLQLPLHRYISTRRDSNDVRDANGHIK